METTDRTTFRGQWVEDAGLVKYLMALPQLCWYDSITRAVT